MIWERKSQCFQNFWKHWLFRCFWSVVVRMAVDFKSADSYPLEDGIDILHVVIQCEAGIDFFFGKE